MIDLETHFANCSDEEKYERYRALWEVVTREKLLTSFPLHLDVELSGKCNLRCEYCFQNGMITGPLGFMKMDSFKTIIDEGATRGLCGLKLQVRGESFLHKQLIECIEYAKQAGIVDVQITTNATLLNSEKNRKLIDSGLDFLIFSFDTHHLDQVSDRKRSQVETNILDFLELREQLRCKKPFVRVQASIKSQSQNEIRDEERRLEAKFHNADIVKVTAIHNFDYEKDGYDQLGENVTLNPCHYLYQRLAVFWDGTVTTCCVDYNAKLELGKIGQDTLAEIWQGAKMNLLREKHLGGLRSEVVVCNKCPVAISGVDCAVSQDHKEQHYEDMSLS
jgi:hypothetical protein